MSKDDNSWRESLQKHILDMRESDQVVEFSGLDISGFKLDQLDLEKTIFRGCMMADLRGIKIESSLDLVLSEINGEEVRQWELPIRIVSILIVATSIIWMLILPGFEPLLAILTGRSSRINFIIAKKVK